MKTDNYGRPEWALLEKPLEPARAHTRYEFYLIGENGNVLNPRGGWNSGYWRSELPEFPNEYVPSLKESIKEIQQSAKTLGLDEIGIRLVRRSVTETTIYTKFEVTPIPELTTDTERC